MLSNGGLSLFAVLGDAVLTLPGRRTPALSGGEGENDEIVPLTCARFVSPRQPEGGGSYEAVDVELHAGQTVARLMRAGLKPLAFGVSTCIHGRRVRLLPRLAACARGGEDWDDEIPRRRLVSHACSVNPSCMTIELISIALSLLFSYFLRF